MTDAMYIILHTGRLWFDMCKKRSSAGRFFCPALHSIIDCFVYFFFLPNFLLMQLLYFLLILFQDFLHNLLSHKPILHFRFGLAVLCIGAFLSFQKHRILCVQSLMRGSFLSEPFSFL